ncbi:CoA-binding protein [uncultured Oscillibacter sp.]|uniref:CoA-binding protein n=1 Tax=uncultured Oscillibacter sp. TaxID=876091 RepID=UPI0025D79195|nr:CoA-binding protein [uncultured Oscillibacter sp.]
MELQEIMRQRVFAVVGNTLDSEKYAYKIKQGMIEKGYTVYAVGKELPSLNDVPEEIDIIDLCIHPAKGLELMRECKKSFKCIVLQPGAESAELVAYLDEKGMPYINGCLLVGMRLFT